MGRDTIDKYLLEKSLIISVTGLSGVVGGEGRGRREVSSQYSLSLSPYITQFHPDCYYSKYHQITLVGLASTYCYSIKYLIAYLT